MRTALITGGSRGFGRAMAAALASGGWKVIITGRDRDRLDESLDELGEHATAIAGDVADPTHRREVAGAVGAGLDLLINNASHLGPSPLRGLASITAEDVARVVDVNLIAPLALIGELLPQIERRSGAVVNLSSDAAVEAYEGWGPYGASKAALDHATAVLALEHPGLAVYSFDPGDMRTEMHQAAFPGEDISDRPEPSTVVPALFRLVHERPPSGRYRSSDILEGVA